MTDLFTNKENRYVIAKYLALILRELAPTLGIEVDQYGQADLKEVLTIVKNQYTQVELAHIKEIVDKDAQRRFEIVGEKIRAKAGHKYRVLIPFPNIEPPEYLFHGTSKESAELIKKSGILKMGKAYVHLATTIERAKRIGLRKSDNPIILKIDARKASESGLRFWRSGQKSPDGEIFLSDEIPSQYVSKIDV